MVDRTRTKLMALLQRAPEGLATDALATALGVTVTAARQHLLSLERDGLVARGASKPSGGRPQQLYVLTATAKETFPRQYSWFSEVLLDALRKEMGSEKLKGTLRILGQEAAGGVVALDPAARAAAVAQRMQSLGYAAHVEPGVADGADGVALVAHNCVFHKLAQTHREVCSFDLGLIGAASGADVDHEECIADGGATCRFRLRARAASGPRPDGEPHT